MKFFVYVFLLTISSICSAQNFVVSEFVQEDQFEMESKFPLLVANDKRQLDAVVAINTYLQYKFLNKVYKNGINMDLFSEVFPPEGEFSGQSEFDYTVHANNDRFFCITISYSATGAYTEYYHATHSFSAKTGEHIVLNDLFSSESKEELGEMVSQTFKEEIETFLAQLDENSEYAFEQKDMYSNCMNRYDGKGFPSDEFELTDSSIVFTDERCSNHAMAALDDLWSFATEMKFDAVRSFLSLKGEALIEGKTWNSANAIDLSDKLLKGSIKVNDKSAPIKAIISSYYGRVYGTYWYDRHKTPISLSGEIKENGSMEIWEEVDNKKTGLFKLKPSGGVLEGSWETPDGTKSFPVKLEL